MNLAGMDAIKDKFLRLIGTYPPTGDVPLTEADLAKLYPTHIPSFTDYLPWVDYHHPHQVFLFQDDVSVGAVWEVQGVDVDGKPQETLDALEKNITRALHAIPEDEDNPWILQVYLQDEPIRDLVEYLRDYATPEARDTQHANNWFTHMENHLKQMCREEGLFEDPAFDNLRWRGIERKIRLCFYRRLPPSAGKPTKNKKDRAAYGGSQNPAEALNQAIKPFIGILRLQGMKPKRLDNNGFREWMFPWLSPKPAGYDTPYAYLKDHPCPDPDDAGAAYDLAATMTLSPPHSNGQGVMTFNGCPQRFISLSGIDVPPPTGALTADQRLGDEYLSATWDRMPRDSIFAMTFVIRNQHITKTHCMNLSERIGKGSHESAATKQQAEDIVEALSRGERIYPMHAGVYIRARDTADLELKTQDALNVFATTSGLNPINPSDDLIAQDCFIRNLPMAFNRKHDAEHSLRARCTYTPHIARILPFYGRGRGSGRPGMLAYNRIGETLMVDPHNKLDRKKTAHTLLFGPTGSGKSANICLSALHSMAMRKPRQIFIEKGNSFGLLGEYYRSQGLSVNSLRFSPKLDLSLPPYAAAEQALAQLKDTADLQEPTALSNDPDELMTLIEPEDEYDDERDYLGEMELLTQLMITGAEPRETEKMSRSDSMVIQRAIIASLHHAVAREKPHPLIEDVCEALDAEAHQAETDTRKDRIKELADNLRLWTQGLRGRFFNRYGEPWQEVDVTIVDMGILTSEQNKDMLAVTLISLLNAITGIGEKYQYEKRSTDVIIDEGHIITKNPVLVKPLVFGVKTWRKLDIWLTQATQNLQDYPDTARAMLNLAEWWYCLTMPPGEIEEIARFRDLSKEEKALLLRASKEPGKYTEGVVMSDTVTSLFRVVMPALALALAQTDPDEKIRRRELMREHNCSELDAALHVAAEIYAQREAA